MMNLRIIGCGEAFDSQLGNNSCLMTGRDLPTVLFDCGYQIPERLWKLRTVHKKIDGIYLTHLHADHSFGIVPLLMRYWEEGREETLRIIGPKGIESFVTKIMSLGYPGGLDRLQFSLKFVELDADDSHKWGPLKFRTARSKHSVKNLSVRVEGPDERCFAISGDGAPTPETVELYSGVNVLLHETYSLAPEFDNHADFETLRLALAGAGIQRIGLTHVSRHFRTRVEQMVYRHNWKEGTNWFVPKPGQSVRV